tara:strand:- start:236 stop:505 length:270 start_codon:yes stop_codon:yes gene_type:complete
MRKRFVIGLVLLILLTTINPSLKLVYKKFNLTEINIENNSLLAEKDIRNLLIPIYNTNLLFLNNTKVKNALMQNSFIESFNIKKNILML